MKKFWICLSLLFSFLFIGNVNATTLNNVDINQTFLDNAWDSVITSKGYIQGDYPYVACGFAYSTKLSCVFNTISDNKPNNQSQTSWAPYLTVPGFEYDRSTNTYTFKNVSGFYISQSNNSVQNFDLITYYGNKIKSANVEYKVSNSFNVIFHLNGGTVMDMSDILNPNYIEEDYSIETTTEELVDYMTKITPMKPNYSFMGWYYDSEFTQPYNSSDTISSDIDLYAKWVQNPNITFHLNGGYIKFTQTENSNVGRHDDEYLTEDFTRQFNSSNDAHDFITSFTIHKSSMQFAGFYYDMNFKTPYNPNDNLVGDINLYAKWRYENVEDFLNTTTFNSYTFDTNHQYAIITRGNNTGDIYLGLNINRYDITVYQYDENINDYHNSNEFCLIPMYSKDSNYYYLLNDTMNDYINVLVLPKETFDSGNYNFLLTDNAYVTYTDNLENAIIYDSNGEEVNTNLSDRYNTLQDSLINDEKDLLTIFKNLLNFKDNRVLSNINTVWNKIKATPIYIYFMILIVGGLIILIIKSARRN